MFEAEIKNEVLKEVLSVVSTLVDEAKFTFNAQGLHLKVVDPAHVAMADITLSSKAFESYKAQETSLGIDIKKLMDVIKLAKPGDVIKLTHDEEKNSLIVKVSNITRRMQLVDTSSISDPKVPNLTLPVSLKLEASHLTQGIRASESVSDHITLTVSAEGFELSSKGDTDYVNLKLPKDLIKEINCSENVKSMFSLSYFSNMIKSVGTGNDVSLSLGTDYPIMMEFEISEGKGRVKYLLAPRIEGD